MMTEISLNILDVAQNSVKAGAKLTEISIEVDKNNDKMTVIIKDDGCGMTKEQVEKVVDPFFTTRTTRKVGLGVPFFKMACESTGGSFSITSQVGVGTIVTAVFILSHIDRMPLGDITSTIHSLIIYNQQLDFLYKYKVGESEFILDTREFRQVLGDDIRFDLPEVSNYIKEYLSENEKEVNEKEKNDTI